MQRNASSGSSSCLILIGMPGVGKSTIGQVLARRLHRSFVDTDCLIEAVYGAPLQSVTDALGKEAFLDVEATVVSALRVHDSVIATGGSVVYREQAMIHLQHMGPLVYLEAPLKLIVERVAHNPDRGLAIAPGQNLNDLYKERTCLYKKYATQCIQVENLSPADCVDKICTLLNLSV